MQYNDNFPHNYSYRDFVQFATPKELEKELLGRLTDILHGSGFDDAWKLEFLKNGNLKFQIGYHNMDENGYYDGWHTCNVYVSQCCLKILRITFTADSHTRHRYLWDNGDYFYSAIHDAFNDLIATFPTRTEYVNFFAMTNNAIREEKTAPSLSSLLTTKEVEAETEERKESISFLSRVFPKLFPTKEEKKLQKSFW